MSRSLTENFVKQFELCKVTSGEVVAVIAELGEKEAYVAASVAAARQLGASALVLHASSLSSPMLPPYEADGREVAALLAAAGEADFVVDCTVGGLIHSDVRTRITGNGKRMLFVAEPNDVLERLMGGEELKASVSAAGDVLRDGRTLHVVSDAGTDLTADVAGEDLPITMQWGYVDVPGRWDHWPSGFAACFPKDRSAQGRIVLQPGDALIPWQRYVRDEVTIEVKDGFITSITGGADAHLLNDYFESWEDPEVWALSHMGWGLLPQARWSAFDVYDPRSLYGQELRSTAGNFMWSTGSNRFADRETPAHLDVPMRSCTVSVDEQVVVRDGKLV
ncbi:hypothetical protein N5P18_10305 [Janibacter terrae]|uniref:2,5-dihydroxypyridine 5,6-dioxygenase n=1 Tax=Janibacter terrae TaxID=103817 RepID=A0ABZ2F9X3_9MICO